MKTIITIIQILLITFEINCQTRFTSTLIVNYLKTFSINQCYFLTCWTKHADTKLVHMLIQANIKYTFLKSEGDFKESLVKERLTHHGYVLDLRCQKFDSNFLSQNIAHDHMRISHPWLILIKDINNSFEKVNLRMDSNVKLAVPITNTTFKILDVYNPGFQINQKAITTEFGYWNGSNLNITNNSTFYLQRKNMSSIQLRTGSVVLARNHSGTFEEYMMDTRNSRIDIISKFHYATFLLIKEVHNFTYTVKIDKATWFGNYQNGTDGGVAKMLYERTIDITCTGGTSRATRVDFYDYLMPSYNYKTCYIFRNPGSYNLLSNQFLKPFAATVWYVTIFVGILICFLLQVFHRIEGKYSGSKTRYSGAAVILTTVGIIFQQDSSFSPRGYASRIVFLFLQILSVLLYNYYTSSIISSLLSKPPLAFDTLYELGHSKLEIGIENKPYTLTFFKIMNDTDVQYIYKNKVFPPGARRLNIYTPEEGIAKVEKGGFAYHTEPDIGYPILVKTFDPEAICDIVEITMIPRTQAGNMVLKKSQYFKLFNISLRKAKEVGLIHRISQIWQSKKPKCLSNVKVIAIGSDQVFIAFLTLFVGMVSSLVILVVEIVWFEWNLDSKFRRQ